MQTVWVIETVYLDDEQFHLHAVCSSWEQVLAKFPRRKIWKNEKPEYNYLRPNDLFATEMQIDGARISEFPPAD